MIFFSRLLPCWATKSFNLSSLSGYGVENIEVSPVGIGIGSAYSGLAVDNNSMQYNLGALGFIKHYEWNLTHYAGPFGTSFESITYVTKFNEGGIGINLKSMHILFSGDNDYVLNNKLMDEELSIFDFALSTGYGFKFNRNFGMGLGLKYIYKSVMDYSAHAFAGDIGFYYTTMLVKPVKNKKARKGVTQKKPDDLRIGFSLQNIGSGISFTGKDGAVGAGDELPLTIRSGVGFVPFENILLGYEFKMITTKKMEFNDDSFNSGIGLELNYRFYRNLVKVMLRSGYGFNFARGMGNGDLNFGGGFELSIGATAYRIDYALKQKEHSDVVGNLHYFSVTIGESPSFFKWIIRKSIPDPKEMIFFNDYYVLKTGKDKVEAEEEKKKKVYQVSIKKISSTDKVLSGSGLIDKFESEIINQIGSRDMLEFTPEKGELAIRGTVERMGELLKFTVHIIDNQTGKNIGKEVFELSEEIFKYTLNYDTVDILVNKDSKNVQIIPVEKGEESSEEEKVFKKLAGEVVGWLENNITEFLSGDLFVKCNFRDVDIYIDGYYYGKTGENKKATVSIFRGEHKLEFKLAKHPTEVRNVDIKPGSKKNLTVNLKKGVVWNDYKFTSIPSGMRIYIDGKNKGQTPLKLKRIDNTGHTLEFEDDDGIKWKQPLSDDDEGIYNIFHMLEYSDSFSQENKFWRKINRNPNISIRIKDGLRISGESKKDIYSENGIFTPYFIPGNIDIMARIKMDINDGFGMIGIMDIDGNGFAYANDGTYHQYLTWDKDGGEEIVQAINIKNKDKEHILKINYKQGIFKSFLGEYDLAEVELKLTSKVRVFILADGLEQGGTVNAECSRITIDNSQ